MKVRKLYVHTEFVSGFTMNRHLSLREGRGIVNCGRPRKYITSTPVPPPPPPVETKKNKKMLLISVLIDWHNLWPTHYYTSVCTSTGHADSRNKRGHYILGVHEFVLLHVCIIYTLRHVVVVWHYYSFQCLSNASLLYSSCS